MQDLKEWLYCPNGCEAPINPDEWVYGWRAECENCGEVLYREL